MPIFAQQTLPLLKPQPMAASSRHAGLTEIVLSQQAQQVQRYTLVLPMLAHLSRQQPDRWFTWIAPVGVTKSDLKAYGFNLTQVQLVHPKQSSDILWMFWEALSNGTSATVVTQLSSLTEDAFNNLETAARSGGAQGFVLRLR